MIVIDTNVLIYAAHEGSAHHATTRMWVDDVLRGSEVLAVPWVAALGFVRITTSPRVFPAPLTVDESLTVVEAWFAHPAVTTVEPSARHLQIVGGLLRRSGTAGNLTTDAHIAALAIERGAAVASYDRDLARFGVEVVVPG